MFNSLWDYQFAQTSCCMSNIRMVVHQYELADVLWESWSGYNVFRRYHNGTVFHQCVISYAASDCVHVQMIYCKSCIRMVVRRYVFSYAEAVYKTERIVCHKQRKWNLFRHNACVGECAGDKQEGKLDYINNTRKDSFCEIFLSYGYHAFLYERTDCQLERNCDSSCRTFHKHTSCMVIASGGKTLKQMVTVTKRQEFFLQSQIFVLLLTSL